MSALTLRPNNKRSCICTSRPREKSLKQQEGHQLLNVSMVQGEALPDNRAYLDGCSTITAFKTDTYLKGIKMVRNGIKINCNAGTVTTIEMGSYR